MPAITISEGLSWKKTLASRRGELTRLRDSNSSPRRGIQFLGLGDARQIVQEAEPAPTYDAKELDKTIARLAREERLLDTAIKRANARTVLEGYDQDDAVLGELV